MATLTLRTGTKPHPVATPEKWLDARKALLREEKKFTRQHDRLKKLRRALPWTKVDQNYRFEGPDGRETLRELFSGKRQLIVYHFMFDPDETEGCPHCSFWADHFDSAGIHLPQRDTTMVVISRAPYRLLRRFQRRMGWKFKWVSSGRNTFNYDFHASFTPEEIRQGPVFYNYVKAKMPMEDREGISTFYRQKNGEVFHTYSTFARGIDLLNPTYNLLDLTAKGRDENPDQPQDWVRHHDKYRRSR